MVLKFIMLWIGGVVLIILGLLAVFGLGCLAAIACRKASRELRDKYKKWKELCLEVLKKI